MSYWNAVIEFVDEVKGKKKKKREVYLVDAISVTDVEHIVAEEFKTYSGDWILKSVSETKYIDVLAKTLKN